MWPEEQAMFIHGNLKGSPPNARKFSAVSRGYEAPHSPLTFPRIRLDFGEVAWGGTLKFPWLMFWHLWFQGLQRSWKINTLKEAMINRTGECGALFLNENPVTSARNCERKDWGKRMAFWNGMISFFGWASMGLPCCPFFFFSLSLSLKQTNP